MKKIVFALLAVMIIGTMTACNGEVDYLLWNEEVKGTPSKTIKIGLSDGRLSFVKGTTKVEETEIAMPYETWLDLYNSGFVLTVYYNDSGASYEEPHQMNLYIQGDGYMGFNMEMGGYIYSYDLYNQGASVRSDFPIQSNATYSIAMSTM